MSDLTIPLHTLDAQRRAADPQASAWVSANAGAGKTKVLTDRVLRLLLAGTLPGRILCLTFTKAAAANMAIKVFDRLGRWVTLSDADLATELRELEGRTPGRDDVRKARRLFARAIETPGGLKIETLHAFCERILHLVPFEANVPARFSVLDENLAAELTARMIDETLSGIVAGREPDLVPAWDIVSAEASGDGLRAVIDAALRDRTARPPQGAPDGLQDLRRRLAAALQVDAAVTPEAVCRDTLKDGLSTARLAEIAAVLAASPKPTDRKRAGEITATLQAETIRDRFERYRTVFFTQAGHSRDDKSFITQSIPDDIRQELFAERDRLVTCNDTLLAAEAFERSMALFTLVDRIRARIEHEKARLGALDFDDLVHKTLDVLSRSDAAWVLYKLDRGIDHVLVDEAQDTNPEQWQILRRLTEDFTAGLGMEQRKVRTLFAVGDPKQSIYGFQGAAPHEFEHSRVHWQKRVAAARQRFEDVRLTLSFRSVRAVLSAVDATFSLPENFRGLSFETGVDRTQHDSARRNAPGEVVLWPVETPQAPEEPDAWVMPLDQPETTSPPVVVARRIAAAVAGWLDKGDDEGRRWRAGDILVLVRKRGAAFEAAIRALKERGVPVAGQDRIDIGSHIAVLDLIAAGRAALLPQDDLTLATALKSPLVGLNEDELFTLAADRQENEALVEAIERLAEAGVDAARRARTALDSWRVIARDFGPFGFFATLLGFLQGRARLIARLGTEAGDAIDAFLSFARNAEMAETPSLITFLSRFDSAEHSIKRDFEAARDEVRVMTVHGAKGLEAPVTILLDGCDVRGRDPALIPVAADTGTLPVWVTGKADCVATAAARGELKAKALEEHNRLLYVAMTRARDKLLVAPFMTAANRSVSPQAWCEMIRRGLEQQPDRLTVTDTGFGPVTIWREGDADGATTPENKPESETKTPAPAWLSQPVAAEPEPLPPLRPSTALGAAEAGGRARQGTQAGSGAKARPGAKARLRGILAHALIERLPTVAPARRRREAEAYLAIQAAAWAQAERSALIDDVLRLLDDPALTPLFGPQARAEVAVAGTFASRSGELPVSGQIDRFAVVGDEVLIADFKTTVRPPGDGEPVPAAYIVQLALYARLLGALYPQHSVRPLIVWTAGPKVQAISPDECAVALAGIGIDE